MAFLTTLINRESRLLLQPAEVAPAGLEAAGVAVADELGQRVLRVFRTASVLVVLDAVDFDSAIGRWEGLEVLPGQPVGFDGVQDPVFENEAPRIEVRRHSQARRRHLAQTYQAAATSQILLAPVGTTASGREMLYRLAIVDPLLSTVDPAKA